MYELFAGVFEFLFVENSTLNNFSPVISTSTLVEAIESGTFSVTVILTVFPKQTDETKRDRRMRSVDLMYMIR